MLIEIYKGIEITHDAIKDIFSTTIVVNTKANGRKDFLTAPRLQKVRDDIDKFLNTNGKTPVVKKAWTCAGGETSFEEVEVIIYNVLADDVVFKQDGRVKTARTGTRYNGSNLYIKCKENNAIISELNKRHTAIEKLEKEMSCMRGKLIPVKREHFVK